jgi:hypothetical protein
VVSSVLKLTERFSTEIMVLFTTQM